MTEAQALADAAKAIGVILSTLNVQKVVCVDDAYDDAASIEDVLAGAAALPIEILRGVFIEIGDMKLDDLDVRATRLRAIWETLDVKKREERAEAVLAAARLRDGQDTDDLGDASVLHELIPKDKLLTLSPKQWEERKEQLLREAPAQRTLFLFDQVMSEDGDREAGIKIIASLLASNNSGELICGLLTHTVTPENQPQEWQNLSRTHNIKRDRFVVVPKQWLRKDPVIFAQILKLVALSPDFTVMKEMTHKIMTDAAATAAAKIEDISIYDLDHIVFRVSADEGLWEPDMLFRLHAMFHRMESRRLAHQNGVLEGTAARLRSVSNIPTDCSSYPAPSTWAIQRQELYESADYLNKNHLPIELGDVFSKTASDCKKLFILLAQPCDLMVRRTGRRHPEMEHVAIVEITQGEDVRRYAEEMVYFGQTPSEQRWFCKLKQVHYVPACMLDLCVFQSDGHAAIQLDGSAPGTARPAWQQRFTILQKLYSRLAKKLDLLSPSTGDASEVRRTKDAIRKALLGDMVSAGPFKGDVVDKDDHKMVEFNCKRVSRLSRSHALSLLMAYTSCLGRPALDADFGKPTSPSGIVPDGEHTETKEATK
ncbi:MAG: hypothetical protein HZA50_17950 [Planctomycetes bacterium]|nr:hypothetical protein [Planctomycetota bacterium]